MNDTMNFIIIAIGFSIVGGIIGFVIHYFKTRQGREMEKILKNPRLLVRELKKHGKIYDIGPNDVKEELEFSTEINSKTGKEIVAVKRTAVEEKPDQVDSDKEKPNPKKRLKRSRLPKKGNLHTSFG